MRVPARPLPDRPSLDQYKKQAKDLLRAWRAGDAEAIARVTTHHPRLTTRGASADAVFQLADAQLVIAREHGDDTWAAFVARVEAIVGAAPAPPWKLAEDAVVRGDAEALAALLREHGDALRRGHPSTWSGGLAPSYEEAQAQAIIAREHLFESWPAFAAFAEARRDPRSPIARFEAAAEAIVGGDLDTLRRLLRDDPDLVRARSARRHRATLFHYVGSNGIEGFRQRAPRNLVDIAAALLDAGADVNATAQMYGPDDRTLDLAATSIHPVLSGVLEPLLAFLLSRGATVGDAHGVAAWSRLINACHANGRPAAAELLAARAPGDLDLEAAAGVGRLDLVAACFTPDGDLRPPITEQQRNSGFIWACEYGRTDVVAFLIARGVPCGERLPPHGQTGLHWAAWGAHIDTLQTLLDAGAPVDARDDAFGGTPLGWALYAWGGGGPRPGDARYYEIVRRLTAAGATLDQEWLDERPPATPLGRALREDPRMRAALSLGTA
jgi:Ankyrin repeats (many copies)